LLVGRVDRVGKTNPISLGLGTPAAETNGGKKG